MLCFLFRNIYNNAILDWYTRFGIENVKMPRKYEDYCGNEYKFNFSKVMPQTWFVEGHHRLRKKIRIIFWYEVKMVLKEKVNTELTTDSVSWTD